MYKPKATVGVERLTSFFKTAESCLFLLGRSEMITTEAKRSYNKRYYFSRPWKRRHDNIVARCRKGRYADKGIKNFLELADVAYLWARDRAYRLKQPSIDRVDNSGHYTLDNCQFIELGENSRKDKIGKKRGAHTQESKDKISKSMKLRRGEKK